MRTIVAALVLLNAASAFAQAPAQTRNSPAPIEPIRSETFDRSNAQFGPLGRPLGEVMTVTIRIEKELGKVIFDDYAVVTHINGAALSPVVRMPYKRYSFADPGELKAGYTYTLRGFQDGGGIGVPGDALSEIGAIQCCNYHFATWLVVYMPRK